jgi:hypothetical protein
VSAVLKEELDDFGLTPLQAEYVRQIVRECPSDPPLAAERAGYSKRRLYETVYELKHNPKVQAAIRREQESLHAEAAPIAFHTLKQLLAPDINASVRFQAAKDILDRCGYRPVEKLVIEHTLSPEERQARIAELHAALGLAKAVEATQQATVIEGERITKTAQK